MRTTAFAFALSLACSSVAAQGDANFTLIGAGCGAIRGGFAVPELYAAPANLPVFGSTFTTHVRNLPIFGTTAVGVIGLSDTTWSGLALPMDLTPFGMFGCTLYTDPLVTMPLPNVGGIGTWTLQVPNDPALQSQVFFQQAVIFSPGSNAVGVIFSNGARGQIGTEPRPPLD